MCGAAGARKGTTMGVIESFFGISFLLVVGFLLLILLPSLRICSEWERKVVLRLGRYTGVRGPGIFFLLPYVETTPFSVTSMRAGSPRSS